MRRKNAGKNAGKEVGGKNALAIVSSTTPTEPYLLPFRTSFACSSGGLCVFCIVPRRATFGGGADGAFNFSRRF